VPTDSNQLELDFHAPVGRGYANWQWDQQQALKRIAQTWGLPINKRVRVKLANIDSEFEGKLCLAEVPVAIDRRRPLTLRVAPLEFSSLEIQSCAVIE
jgi:hypothetical protein